MIKYGMRNDSLLFWGFVVWISLVLLLNLNLCLVRVFLQGEGFVRQKSVMTPERVAELKQWMADAEEYIRSLPPCENPTH